MAAVLTEDSLTSDYVVDFNLEPVEDMVQGLSMNMGRMHAAAAHMMPTHPTWMSHHHHHMTPTHASAMGLVGEMQHSQITGTTPPTTPPSGSSPTSAASLPPSPQFHCLQSNVIMDDKSWNSGYLPNRYSGIQEPLDLRPGLQCGSDQMEGQTWMIDRKYDFTSHHQPIHRGTSNLFLPQVGAKTPSHLNLSPNSMPTLHQHHHHLGGESAYISDDELTALTVRELNRRLHNMPKDSQTKYKQRRRTLKNRGYAQSCRTKRQSYRQELESLTNALKDKLQRIQDENTRLVHINNSNIRKLDSMNKQIEKLTMENESYRIVHQQQQRGQSQTPQQQSTRNQTQTPQQQVHSQPPASSQQPQAQGYPQAPPPESSALFHSM